MSSLRSRTTALAMKAVEKLLSDPKRAEQLGELFVRVQKGRQTVAAAQEAALNAVGLASSGDVKAAGRRLAALRRSARKLDEKLSQVATRLASQGKGSSRNAS